MTTNPASQRVSRSRLIEITLDQGSLGRGNADIEHEREVAIYDLLDSNEFAVEGYEGPFRLRLSLADDRLQFAIADEADVPMVTHALPLSALRRILKDYFLVLDSYYQAVRTAQPSRIEAIDVGRRGLHDEGSQLLIDRLTGKIATDFETARRLFTLIAALHWKG